MDVNNINDKGKDGKGKGKKDGKGKDGKGKDSGAKTLTKAELDAKSKANNPNQWRTGDKKAEKGKEKGKGKGKQEYKGKGKGTATCFICNGDHFCKDCPKRVYNINVGDNQSSAASQAGTISAVLVEEDASWCFGIFDNDADEIPVMAIVSEVSEQQPVWILTDSGAAASVCGPNDFPEYSTDTNVQKNRLTSVQGTAIQHYGQKNVKMTLDSGRTAGVEMDVTDSAKAVMSIARRC